MFRVLMSRLRIFTAETRGNMTVEAAILMPALMLGFVSMYIFFDAFRQQAVNQKAAYTIADMLSRETDYITPEYMDRSRDMLEWLTSQHRRDLAFRVTVITWYEARQKYKVMWSKTRGAISPYQNNDMGRLADKLPVMVHNEQLILVDTSVEYDPPLNLGFLPREINTFCFTRPRFTPQLLWGGIGV